MSIKSKKRRLQLPSVQQGSKLSVIVLAVGFALGNSTHANAACMPASFISFTLFGPEGCVAWSAGDFTVTSTGTLSGAANAVEVSGVVGTLDNNGVINGTNSGIHNTGAMTALNNNKTISGGAYGIHSDNGSSITSLHNTATGTISGDTGVLAGNLTPSGSITITTITNDGTISGNMGVGTSTNATIGTLVNTGTITGAQGGIGNAGNINILNNSGTISSNDYAIYNAASGTFGSITNSGTISSNGYAIYNAGAGTLGPITNSGTIAGSIRNDSANNLTINGASGASFGILTGSSAGLDTTDQGLITNTSSNLIFNSGNLLLNNNINVGTRTVSNTAATLQVNNGITVTGNYNQGAGATLLIGVANGAVATGAVNSDNGYGRLVVSGSATIAAGSAVTLKPLTTYAFAAGQRFVVVTAAGAASYNENALNYAASGYTGSLSGSTVTSGGTNNLVVTLGTNPATPATSSPATVPNAVAALGGLSRYTGIDPALLNLFNAGQAMNLGSTADANRAGRQLNPVSSPVSSQAVTAPTVDTLNIVAAHTDSLRLAQTGRASGLSAGSAASATGVWGQAFAGQARQDERNDVSAYRANYSGLLFGVDQQLDERWNIGGAFSYSNARIRDTGSNAGDSSDVDAYGLLAYGSYSGQPWYLNFSAGAVQQRYATTRTVSFPGFAGVATGKFDGMQYVAKAEVGYPLATGSVTTTPLLGLTYSRLNQDAYTESGGNGAALAVGSTSVNSLQSDLGVKFERELTTSYGNLIPSLKLAWRHEFDNNRVATNARFAADPSGATSFTSLGVSPIKNSAMISLGATLLRQKNLSLSVRYDLQTGSGFLAQSGSLRLRKLF
ncbi:autotransporter outer membrane beta-barrel domain-containing protein [Herminiimonas arsenitoxidans]|uniref:autotransporter outer membrane beta-barrel domain-containing protein n=1 Tax=Herminiimonas arsenitoxidans TaxID=1809410 RepID=UPI0009709E68|nr:autotransporter domain-containing protein [Herminiimonas arsenitoxidans]